MSEKECEDRPNDYALYFCLSCNHAETHEHDWTNKPPRVDCPNGHGKLDVSPAKEKVVLLKPNPNLHPEDYFDRKEFVPQLLADAIQKEYIILTPEKDDPHIYDPETGCYTPAKTLLKKIAQEKLGHESRKRHVDETIHYLANATLRSQKLVRPPANLICLKNGVLDLATKPITVNPHSPNWFFTNSLPVAYNPDATSPKIDAFLEQVLPPNGKTIAHELIGYCLYRKYPIQKAFMLIGEGRNGKSTFLSVLRAFLGKENTSNVTLQDLDRSRFAVGQLDGKLANICADLSSRALKDTGAFKMLTGEDPLTLERKFHDPMPYDNYAKLVFSANTIPTTTDSTDAFFRRWIILNFPRRFDENPVGDALQANPNLKKELTLPQELSGLLNHALTALELLLARGQFSSTPSIADARRIYLKASEPIAAFNMEHIIEAPEEYSEKEALYNFFVGYCNRNTLPACDKSSFFKKLGSLRQLISRQKTVNHQRVTIIEGIKYVESSDNENEDGDGSIEPKISDFQ